MYFVQYMIVSLSLNSTECVRRFAVLNALRRVLQTGQPAVIEGTGISTSSCTDADIYY